MVASPELTVYFSPHRTSADHLAIYFSRQESAELTNLMKRVEESGRPYMRVIARADNSNEIIADFDVTGVAVNLTRSDARAKDEPGSNLQRTNS